MSTVADLPSSATVQRLRALSRSAHSAMASGDCISESFRKNLPFHPFHPFYPFYPQSPSLPLTLKFHQPDPWPLSLGYAKRESEALQHFAHALSSSSSRSNMPQQTLKTFGHTLRCNIRSYICQVLTRRTTSPVRHTIVAPMHRVPKRLVPAHQQAVSLSHPACE